MQWFAYDFQVRLKPGVLIQLMGEEGIGKSAIFGHNRSGPGILQRIYAHFFAAWQIQQGFNEPPLLRHGGGGDVQKGPPR